MHRHEPSRQRPRKQRLLFRTVRTLRNRQQRHHKQQARESLAAEMTAARWEAPVVLRSDTDVHIGLSVAGEEDPGAAWDL